MSIAERTTIVLFEQRIGFLIIVRTGRQDDMPSCIISRAHLIKKSIQVKIFMNYTLTAWQKKQIRFCKVKS